MSQWQKKVTTENVKLVINISLRRGDDYNNINTVSQDRVSGVWKKKKDGTSPKQVGDTRTQSIQECKSL